MLRLLFASFIALGLAAAAHAETNVCQSAMLAHPLAYDPATLGDPPAMTRELPLIDIKAQCLGSCTVQALTGLIEQAVRVRTGESIPLSSDYLIRSAYIEWLMEQIVSVAKRGEVPSLRDPEFFRPRLILSDYIDDEILDQQLIGLIPIEAMRSPRPFEQELRDGLVTARMMPPESSWFRRVYHRSIFSLHGRLRRAVQDLVRVLSDSPSARLNHTLSQIRGILSQSVDSPGAFPGHFVFQGRRYTPQSFQAAYFPEDSYQIDVWWRAHEAGGVLPYFKNDYRRLDPRHENIIEAQVRESVDAGYSVIAGLPWHEGRLIEDVAGDTFVRDGEARYPLSSDGRFPEVSGDHVIQIVGYHLGPDGTADYYKLQNSWGTNVGDRGYYYMRASMFWALTSHLAFLTSPTR